VLCNKKVNISYNKFASYRTSFSATSAPIPSCSSSYRLSSAGVLPFGVYSQYWRSFCTWCHITRTRWPCRRASILRVPCTSCPHTFAPFVVMKQTANITAPLIC